MRGHERGILREGLRTRRSRLCIPRICHCLGYVRDFAAADLIALIRSAI